MDNKLNLKDFKWINKPINFKLTGNELYIQTDPRTDFWQRTYYGFQVSNGPAFLTEIEDDFSFTVKTNFSYKNQFDQCGILLYQNSENWIKASVEQENNKIARLGSVVTNLGFSDWATKDIPANISGMWYRLSRRGQDFFIEFSEDAENYKQMRILHMHKPIAIARIGVYACSPLQSSFRATFSEFRFEPCKWELHK
ncbi:DUF1349 domain-containing protein [Draconibacterium sp.]|nr:DUF1349 domain-containing protein [Draconibacterium sp.]